LPPKLLTVRDVIVYGVWFTCLPLIIPYKMTLMIARLALYPAKTIFKRQFPDFREDILSKKRVIQQKYSDVVRPLAGWVQTLIIRYVDVIFILD